MPYTAFVKEIYLPPVPEHIKQEVFDAVKLRQESPDHHTLGDFKFPAAYDWIQAPPLTLEWCKQNISQEIGFGIQIITGNFARHQDRGTKVKFINNISTGGENVITRFFTGDEVVTEVKFKENAWYILDVSEDHDVTNVPDNKVRIAITGRISP
jgi:hypothetical protein